MSKRLPSIEVTLRKPCLLVADHAVIWIAAILLSGNTSMSGKSCLTNPSFLATLSALAQLPSWLGHSNTVLLSELNARLAAASVGSPCSLLMDALWSKPQPSRIPRGSKLVPQAMGRNALPTLWKSRSILYCLLWPSRITLIFLTRLTNFE